MIAIPVSKFTFIDLIDRSTKLQVPCFPGDTSIIDFKSAGLKFRIKDKPLKVFDTAFFRYAWNWNRAYHFKADSLTRLQLGNKTGNLYLVNKLAPNFEGINKQLFKTDSIIVSRQSFQLDSLLNAGEISTAFYHAYEAVIASQYIDFALSRFNETNNQNYLSGIDSTNWLSDQYLEYDATGLFKNAIRHFVDVKIGKNNYHKYSSHEIALDYTKLYDSCPFFLSSRLLDLARYICLGKIKKYNNSRVFTAYYNKFTAQTADTALIKYASLKLGPVDLHSNSDYLVTYEHTTLPLNKLLHQYAGKQIYIDFWASWCLPCIRSIRASKELLNSIDTSKSVVLYLSIDDDHGDWIRAAVKEGLRNTTNSYRIADSKNSNFLQQIKLKDIPRYVLINNYGKIISADAPAPESNGFKGLLAPMTIKQKKITSKNR